MLLISRSLAEKRHINIITLLWEFVRVNLSGFTQEEQATGSIGQAGECSLLSRAKLIRFLPRQVRRD